MKKMIYFTPAIIALLLYIVLGFVSGFGAINPMVWLWIAIIFISAVVMLKDKWYGCIGGFRMENDILLKYRILNAEEVNREIFKDFIRHQNVTKCWRKENGRWIIKEAPFIDDWTEKDYQILIYCLKNTITSNGFVYAAFYDGKLKGFVSVESEIFGGKQGYCDLSSIHISEDMRRKGIGRTLFLAAKEWAKQKGAKKLYISAHSAVESQAFYKSMGCVEAEVYNQKHVEDEPYDCQLECSL